MFPLALFKPLCFLVPLLVIVRAEEAPEEFHFRLGDGPEQVAMTWVIVAILVLLSGMMFSMYLLFWASFRKAFTILELSTFSKLYMHRCLGCVSIFHHRCLTTNPKFQVSSLG